MFWRLTLREIGIITNGFAARLRREHNYRAWLAWHTAYLTAYAPSKSSKFVRLKSLLHGSGAKSRSQPLPWEEALAIAEMWTAALQR